MDTLEWEKYISNAPALPDLFKMKLKTCEVKAFSFCQRNNGKHPIALVTSGDTAVPLLQQSISTGNRGAASTEYLLAQGYAVIFLYRENSYKPFLRHLDPESFIDKFQEQTKGEWQLSQKQLEKLPPHILANYEKVKTERRLLWLPFDTVLEYLFQLRLVTMCMQHLLPKAMVYSTSAVADYYIPLEQLKDHTIQSDGPLSAQLEILPKMLQHHLLSVWAPDLFDVTFTLGTDDATLLEYAQGTLNKYGHCLVIGNLLETIKDEATFVTKDGHYLVSRTEHQKSQNTEIEELIVHEVVTKHSLYQASNKNILT